MVEQRAWKGDSTLGEALSRLACEAALQLLHEAVLLVAMEGGSLLEGQWHISMLGQRVLAAHSMLFSLEGHVLLSFLLQAVRVEKSWPKQAFLAGCFLSKFSSAGQDKRLGPIKGRGSVRVCACARVRHVRGLKDRQKI